MEPLGKLHEHIEKLRVLYFVGRSGSITRAASLLHITQAAASHSIRVLEEVLDVKLLHREARGVKLTDSGKILFDFSQRLLSDIQSVEIKAVNPYQRDAGTLRVGTHETLAIHVWPPFLRRFNEEHKKVSVSLISGRVDALISGLTNHEYQVVLTVEPTKRDEMHITEVYSGVMGMFVGTGASVNAHPILGRSKVSLAEANEVPILTDAASHLRQNLPLPMFLLDRGFRLNYFYELNSFEAAMRLAMVGMGVAVVPERNALAYVKDGSLRPLRVAEIDPKKFGNHSICASILKDQKQQPVVRTFFDELLVYCKKALR